MNTFRIMSFLGIAVIAIMAPPWLLAPLACLYAFLYRAYELLFLAVIVDAYFGVAVGVPYYTLAALAILLIAESAKPHLSFRS